MPQISIDAPGGGTFQAYKAGPDTAPAPAIILLQEVYGVNRFMQRISDFWAGQGFLAICPDIYWRIEPGIVLDPETPGHREQALAAGQKLDIDQAVEDIGAVIDQVRALPDCNGKVATSGYCLGGKLAYLTGTRGNADCNVSYYGVGIENFLNEATNLTTPLLLHIGGADPWTPPEVRKQLDGVLSGFIHVSSYVYDDTDHAFAREGASSDVPEMRELANGRTRDFLHKHMG